MTQSEVFLETRPWVLGSAVVLLTYAAVGGTAGVLWLIALVQQLAQGLPPAKPVIIVWSVNLLFAPVGLVCGVLAVEYFTAAWLACWRHDSGDLERTSTAFGRLRNWAISAMGILVAFLACMFVATVLTGEFPG